jgi:hypothetical protein
MASPSFVQRFAASKKEGSGNSIQKEVILEDMLQAQEDLALQVSQDTSSISNIEVILTCGSKSLAPDIKGADESLLEQEIEENSLERLHKSIELAASPEELSALMQQYEELVASWSDRASKLRSEKHLKEYMAITAALTMLQKMMQNPDATLSGKKLAEILQNSLTSQAQAIEAQAKTMQAQNQKLHEQTGQLTKQLSGLEQSLQTVIDALKKEPGKLTPQELQNNLKQLQETLKQVQELREKITNDKPLDFKEVLENLQKIQQQHQRLIEGGKLGDTTLQAALQLQHPLQQTLRQANLVQQLQENISRLQTTQIEQIRQNSGQVMQAQIAAIVTDRLSTQVLPPETKAQIPLDQKQPLNQVQKEYTKDPSRPDERISDLLQKIQEKNASREPEIKNASFAQQQTPVLATESAKDPNILARYVGERVSALSQKIQETNVSKERSIINTSLIQQQASPERSVTIKDNVIDITARFKERIGVESSTYKPISKDALSRGHACTGSCSHGHSHATHQDIQPKMMGNDTVSKAHICTGPNCCGGKGHNHIHTEQHKHEQQHTEKPKPLSGFDVVSKGHVCTGPNCCGGKSHGHIHDNPQILKPKSLGNDVVSKANAHGPGCGCSSCGGGHDHNKHQHHTQHEVHAEKHEAKPKHEHGPSCSCCGHGAKATEIGRSQQMARVS